MTRTTNARVAGSAFLLYFAFGITALVLSNRAISGEGIAEKLTTMAQHASNVRLVVLLEVFCGFAALVLAVTLYAITRDEDHDIAMLGLTCRVGEGLAAFVSTHGSLALLALATATGIDAPDPQAMRALGAFVLHGQSASSLLFGAGSTCFCWLLFRGRMIPSPLAWLGFLASVLWVVGTSLQIAGAFPRAYDMVLWIPMAAFEIPFAVWLIVKGVAMPARMRSVPAPVSHPAGSQATN